MVQYLYFRILKLPIDQIGYPIMTKKIGDRIDIQKLNPEKPVCLGIFIYL